MAIRFTDFVTSSNEDIKLYFLEEYTDTDLQSFVVQAKDHVSVTLHMYKQGEKIWTEIPDDAPQWVIDIEPHLSKVLEQKLQKLQQH